MPKKCEACGGSGLLACELTTDRKLNHVVIIERCDACDLHKTDMEAAMALYYAYRGHDRVPLPC